MCVITYSGKQIASLNKARSLCPSVCAISTVYPICFSYLQSAYMFIYSFTRPQILRPSVYPGHILCRLICLGYSSLCSGVCPERMVETTCRLIFEMDIPRTRVWKRSALFWNIALRTFRGNMSALEDGADRFS